MRTKAFLKGTWEWQQDYEEKTRVEVFVSEDDSECVGVVKNVGTSLSWYRYEVGEVYWKDFLFEEGVLVSSFNLTKLQNGDPIGSTAFYTLYFDSGTIHIQLAPKSSRHRITNSIRTWVKTTD